MRWGLIRKVRKLSDNDSGDSGSDGDGGGHKDLIWSCTQRTKVDRIEDSSESKGLRNLESR